MQNVYFLYIATQMRSSTMKIALAFFLVFGAANSFAGELCEPLFKTKSTKLSFEQLNNVGVSVNDIAVTGDFIIPIYTVLKNLNLTIGNHLQNKSIVSLGEGTSGLVPLLAQTGLNAKGVDIWYNSKDMPDNEVGNIMRDYVKKYRNYLIQADAAKVPLQSGSIDLILSHLLLNNVSHAKQRAIIKEVLRLLKPGGEAKLYGISFEHVSQIINFLNKQYKDEITFALETKTFTVNFRGNHHVTTLDLLTIQKH